MIFERKTLEPANDRLFEVTMYVALILTAISLEAAILLVLYYLRSWLKRTCWHGEADLVSQYSSGTELGPMNGMNRVSIRSDKLEHGQERSGDDDIDDIVVIMKGIQETDQVSVFIVKGADDMDKISSHVPGGTKCGHERQQYGSCYVADIATVDGVVSEDNADNGTEQQIGQAAPAL